MDCYDLTDLRKNTTAGIGLIYQWKKKFNRFHFDVDDEKDIVKHSDWIKDLKNPSADPSHWSWSGGSNLVFVHDWLNIKNNTYSLMPLEEYDMCFYFENYHYSDTRPLTKIITEYKFMHLYKVLYSSVDYKEIIYIRGDWIKRIRSGG